MLDWIKSNRAVLIRNSFLLPILLVVIMSISHVVSWYDLGNSISWAIYLSIAIEIFALASISAASIKTNKAAIWFLFGIVTAIQIVGNIFYEFKDIDMNGDGFQSWVLLIEPFFLDWEVMDHRRFLAIIQGGTLPIMSLTALHFYIQFKEKDETSEKDAVKDYFDARNKKMEEMVNANSEKSYHQEVADKVFEKIKDLKKEGKLHEPTAEDLENEPTALANSGYREKENETDEEWDEDHALDMVTNRMIKDLGEEVDWEDLYQKLNEEDREKEEQRELLAEMMKSDEESGIYDTGDLLKKSNKKESSNNNTSSEEGYINKNKPSDRRIGKGDSRPPKNWG